MRAIACFILPLLVVSQIFAAKLNTQCTMDVNTTDIQGLNNSIPFTIASVTKVFTTHWAIARLGANYRYNTLVHITPISQGVFDVHLQGDLFPYFDRGQFQFLVGELNRLNVKNIRYLTYDEYFIYSSDMRTNPMLAHSNYDLTSEDIMKDLREDTQSINVNLAALNAKVLALENLVLPKALTLTIRDIHPLLKMDFKTTPVTKSFNFYSSPLHRVLKELNRNSHNYASEAIFAKLSMEEEYRNFISSLPDIPWREIAIFNGSGYPFMSGSTKIYNKASCAAVLRVMFQLRELLNRENLDFKDVVPVAGKDADGDGMSTVTQIYGDPKTNGSLLGKTGTVSDTIALGGMVSTDEQNTLFYTSFNVANSFADRDIAYTKIKDWIITWLIGDQGKSDLNTYLPKSFLPFDKNSRLQLMGSGTPLP